MTTTSDQPSTAPPTDTLGSVSEVQNEKTPHGAAPTTNGQPQESKPQKQEQENDKSKDADKKKDDSKDKQPAGGFDNTPIPSRPAGYTVKFTFHRATNLPMADINAFSSDPYILAQLNSGVPTRHKEDPYLRHRTQTVRRTTEPAWNDEWIVANVPSTGFKLKARVYDEDPADQDDLLGTIHITVTSINEQWPGIKDEQFRVRARAGSKRAYFLQAMTTCFRENKHFRGEVWISAEVLGRTQPDGQNGRLYTVGPTRWIRHYSPMLGRMVGMKEPDAKDSQAKSSSNQTNGTNEKSTEQKKAERYNFQANQFQLEGPVPAELYHRFVEFKPWVKRMFTGGGFSGFLLGKALHHQHSRVYNFGRTTEYGMFPKGPSEDVTRKFLDLVHYDQGGRIFTYVLTLDSLWRFTETGKEFGIDMLSKHTMHSDVSIYIAFSGEFFIRRLKHANRPPPPDPVDETSQSHPPEHKPNESHPPDEIASGPPDDDPPKDPKHYQLVIDNDSGTYRPNAKMLPLLKDFMARALPGLHIMTLDCQADEEKMGKMKQQQRDRKKKEGDHIVYTQGNQSDSSISSSDEEDLDALQAGLSSDSTPHEHGAFGQATKDAKLKQKAKIEKAKRQYGGLGKDNRDPDAAAGAEKTADATVDEAATTPPTTSS